jgi:MFS transporter, YNFM family, putative membrane transport protein
MQEASANCDQPGHKIAGLTTCLIGFSLFFDLYFTQIILGPIAEFFGTTVLQARYTMVAATAGVVFAPLFAGRVRQKKAVQVATLAAMMIGAAIEAAAPDLWTLIGMRFCQGILVGILFIQAMGRIATIHRARFGALSNGLFVSATTLGSFTSRFLPPSLVDEFGIRATFLVLASVLLLICAAVHFSPVPEASADASHEPAVLAVAASGQRKAFVIEYLLGFCVLFSQTSIWTYLPIRLARAPFMLDDRQLAFMAFVFLLGAVSASLTIRVTRNDLSRSAISLFFGCAAVGALMTGTFNLYAVAGGLAVFTVGSFALQAMLSRRLTARAGASTPRIFAMYMSIYYMGGSVGSYLSGDIFVARGFSGVVLAVMTVAALGGTALYIREALGPTLGWRAAMRTRTSCDSEAKMAGQP